MSTLLLHLNIKVAYFLKAKKDEVFKTPEYSNYYFLKYFLVLSLQIFK